MPRSLPLNPDLLRTVFRYNPETGNVHPRPTALMVVRRINSKQWEVGPCIYGLHRIVWAMHNPDNPNPVYILFRDGNRANTRIENLEPKNVHPRWEGHVKQQRGYIDKHGNVKLRANKTTQSDNKT